VLGILLRVVPLIPTTFSPSHRRFENGSANGMLKPKNWLPSSANLLSLQTHDVKQHHTQEAIHYVSFL
jgi:hypothetical protein